MKSFKKEEKVLYISVFLNTMRRMLTAPPCSKDEFWREEITGLDPHARWTNGAFANPGTGFLSAQ